MALPLDQQNIISLLAIESLPEERKVAFLDKVSELVEKRLLIRVVESLTPEKKAQFDQLLDQGSEEEIGKFLGETAPDLPRWTDEEVAKIKAELAQTAPPLD